MPFYLLFATIHSTEVGNGQAIIKIAHRLATENSPEIQEILDNLVLFIVPSQNPDGQVMVIDHWYETEGTSYDRRYPNLYRMKLPTRIGMWKVPNNMPAGWMMWLFEQYGFNHRIVSSEDFAGDLSAKYDVIVLPAGTSKERIVQGLDADRHDASWKWAHGVGEEGLAKLAQWVKAGGTLVAVGNSVETARQLLELPIDKALPDMPRRFGRQPAERPDEAQIAVSKADQMLKDAFQSPAQLLMTLEKKVVDPASIFFCPGSLLKHEYDTNHPVAYGMPSEWPIWFRYDQAYRLKPGFEMPAEVVSRYPEETDLVASGWLLGDALLRDRANIMAFQAGRGKVVTLATQVSFRTQPRATFKLLFNAIYMGPAIPLVARDLSRLSTKSQPTE